MNKSVGKKTFSKAHVQEVQTTSSEMCVDQPSLIVSLLLLSFIPKLIYYFFSSFCSFFLSLLFCPKANSCMLFPIFLFNQQHYSHLQASGGLTICHLRETRRKQLLNPGFEQRPPSWKVPHAFQFFIQFSVAAIWGVKCDKVETKHQH